MATVEAEQSPNVLELCKILCSHICDEYDHAEEEFTDKTTLGSLGFNDRVQIVKIISEINRDKRLGLRSSSLGSDIDAILELSIFQIAEILLKNSKKED